MPLSVWVCVCACVCVCVHFPFFYFYQHSLRWSIGFIGLSACLAWAFQVEFLSWSLYLFTRSCFIFYPSIYVSYGYIPEDHVRPASWPSCMAKTLTLDITRKLFNQIFFICAMLVGTIGFYHFIPLSLTLILPSLIDLDLHSTSHEWNTVETCCCDKPNIHFIASI